MSTSIHYLCNADTPACLRHISPCVVGMNHRLAQLSRVSVAAGHCRMDNSTLPASVGGELNVAEGAHKDDAEEDRLADQASSLVQSGRAENDGSRWIGVLGAHMADGDSPGLQIENSMVVHEDCLTKEDVEGSVVVATQLGISLALKHYPGDCRLGPEDSQGRLYWVVGEDTAAEEDSPGDDPSLVEEFAVGVRGRGRSKDCATSMPWLRLDVSGCVTLSRLATYRDRCLAVIWPENKSQVCSQTQVESQNLKRTLVVITSTKMLAHLSLFPDSDTLRQSRALHVLTRSQRRRSTRSLHPPSSRAQEL